MQLWMTMAVGTSFSISPLTAKSFQTVIAHETKKTSSFGLMYVVVSTTKWVTPSTAILLKWIQQTIALKISRALRVNLIHMPSAWIHMKTSSSIITYSTGQSLKQHLGSYMMNTSLTAGGMKLKTLLKN